jgi:hypothetical protein
VFLYLDGRPLWFRRVNSIDLFVRLVDHAAGAELAPEVAARSFTWTGGGVGREPPIADA